MSVLGLYKDVFAENSQTFLMTSQMGLVYRFELNLAQMKYMAKTRLPQIQRLHITDLRSAIQNISTGELVQASSELMELSLTEG